MTCENCKRLQARIAELEDALSASSESAYEAECAMTSRLERQGRELASAQKSASEARDAEYFREDTIAAIERAHKYGFRNDEERLLAKLKRGW